MKESVKDQWRQLYEIALKIRKQKPWQWMNAGKIFAIVDPMTQITYYCAIQSERYFDEVQLLVGEDGLNHLLGLLETISRSSEYLEENDQSIMDSLAAYMLGFEEHSLACMFGAKDYLSQYELDVLDALELSFRGERQWIAFKHNQPGQPAEAIHHAEHVRLLTVILEQVYTLCAMEKKQSFLKDIIGNESVPEIYKWQYDKAQDVWQGTFIRLESIRSKMTLVAWDNPLDKARLRHIKGSRKVYELLRLYMPLPIKQSHGLLRYPLTFLLVDMEDGMIVWSFIDTGDEGYEGRLHNNLSAFFIREGQKPSQLLTADQIVYQDMVDFCEKNRIFLEYLAYTITGDEILSNFLQSSNIAYQGLDDGMQRERNGFLRFLCDLTMKQEALPEASSKAQSKPAQIIDFRTGKPK